MRLPSQTFETTATILKSPLPRLGQISFINCLPVVIPIRNNHVPLDAEMVLGSPAVLNQAYQLGELDLGAMSSFFFLERNDLKLIPTLSISAYGDVGSVLFFAKENLQDLNNRLIAVPASSATSVNLLQVLLQEEFNVKPRIIVQDKPDIADASIAGCLVIGDDALSIDAQWSSQYLKYDLGGWWKRLYNLPMVFGLWAARTSWVDENAEVFQAISTSLGKAKDAGLNSCFPLVLEEAKNKTGHALERLEHYFLKELNFEFTDKHLQGLNLYSSLCRKHGLL